MRIAELAPSFLCSDPLNLGEALKRTAVTGTKILHLDVMDNHLVAGFGFSPFQVKQIRAHTSLFLDVHLMTRNAEQFALEFYEAGATRVLVHAESEDYSKAMDLLLLNSKNVGIALKPDTAISVLDEYKNYISSVLVFTVVPGKRGQQILSHAPERVRSIRKYIEDNRMDCSLQVDGGVFPHSIKILRKSGADTFVVGSAYYGDGSASVEGIQKNISLLFDEIK